MIGALAYRYLGTTPACLLDTLLAVALKGKGPQQARPGWPGLRRQTSTNFACVCESVSVSQAVRPSASNRTVSYPMPNPVPCILSVPIPYRVVYWLL